MLDKWRSLAEEDTFALTRAEALAQVLLIEAQIGDFGAARLTLRAFVELFNSEAGRDLRVRAAALVDYPELLARAIRFGDVQCPAAAAAIAIDRPDAEAEIAYFR